jgi:hypothetical protein
MYQLHSDGKTGQRSLKELYIQQSGREVAQLVEALRYKQEGRGFVSR